MFDKYYQINKYHSTILPGVSLYSIKRQAGIQILYYRVRNCFVLCLTNFTKSVNTVLRQTIMVLIHTVSCVLL